MRPELVQCVETALREEGAGLSEYDLIKRLQKAGCFEGWVSTEPTLALFQKHFAVMHVLYRLQERFNKLGQRLEITPLLIRLSSVVHTTINAAENAAVSADPGELRQFYLDWGHFERATPETVVELLTSFWRRFAAVDQRQEALQTLGLSAEASWGEVQAQYRRLAAENHPDRGGDSAIFRRVREAYETLKNSKN